MPDNGLIEAPVRGLAISRRRTAYEPLRNVRWHYDGVPSPTNARAQEPPRS